MPYCYKAQLTVSWRILLWALDEEKRILTHVDVGGLTSALTNPAFVGIIDDMLVCHHAHGLVGCEGSSLQKASNSQRIFFFYVRVPLKEYRFR